MVGVTRNSAILPFAHIICQTVLRDRIQEVVPLLLRIYSCITGKQYLNIQRKFLEYYEELTRNLLNPDVNSITVPITLRIRFMEFFRNETREVGDEVDFAECELLSMGIVRSRYADGLCLHEVFYVWLSLICNDICYNIYQIHNIHMGVFDEISMSEIYPIVRQDSLPLEPSCEKTV